MSSNLFNSSIEDMRNKVFETDDQNHIDKNLGVNGNQTDLEALYANFLYNGSDTNKDYHKNAIKTADLVLKIAMLIFLCVTIFMCVIVGILAFKKDVSVTQILLPVISSSIVDILSVTIIWAMKKWLESKNSYFEESIKGEELIKMIGLIRSMPEGNPKNNMIEKLVDNFCTIAQHKNSKTNTKRKANQRKEIV